MSIEQPSAVQTNETRTPDDSAEVLDDKDYEALRLEVGELRAKLEEFEREYPFIGHSFHIDDIREEVAKRLDFVAKNKGHYPQFAEEIESLEKTRGLKPGVTRDSLVIGAVIGSSAAPYKGLRTLFSKDMLSQYHQLTLAKHSEQLKGIPRELYKEFEVKSARLSAEDARRENLSAKGA